MATLPERAENTSVEQSMDEPNALDDRHLNSETSRTAFGPSGGTSNYPRENV